VPWPGGRRLAAARRLLDRTTARLIAQRRPAAEQQDDLLSALLDGRGNGGGGLSDAAIRDEVVSLLIAAVDTTPGTLAWTWLLLSRHPDAEARLHAELEAVLGDRPPTVDDIPKLPYLEMVLNEVLRLYPPVHFIDRRTLADVELDGCPVPAGSFLLLSPLFTHRDPRFYAEPTAFRPERWGREQPATRPRYAYFPFGGGPHTCIGMVLARMELSLIVATIASRWRLRPVPAFPANPSPQTSSFPMTLVAR
jgi:cytochrome P450